VHGTALIKGKGNRRGYIGGRGKGPGLAMRRIRDRKKDDFYSANGARKRAGAALDLRGASLTMSKRRKALVAHIRARSLKSLSVPGNLGGSTAEWIIRFTTYNKHTLGNGHVYYAGMESVSGGKPTFYDGDTAPPTQQVQLSENFSSAHVTRGKYHPKSGKIRIVIPFKDVVAVKRHARLYSVTAFSGTTAASLAVPNPSGVQGEINQIDATSPFDYKVSRHAKTASAAAAARSQHDVASGSWLTAAVGGVGGLLALGLAALVLLRRRRHQARVFAH
jgi:uncharacterized protein (TIGR03382 family)